MKRLTPLTKIGIGAGVLLLLVVLVPVVLAPMLFDTLFPSTGEVAQLQEWSVLQGVEAAHRDEPQKSSALIVRRALYSEYTAIGFPARGRNKGYVWLLANPSTNPRVKQLPHDEDFVVSEATIGWLKTQTALDPRVSAYLKLPHHQITLTSASSSQGQRQ